MCDGQKKWASWKIPYSWILMNQPLTVDAGTYDRQVSFTLCVQIRMGIETDIWERNLKIT